MKVINKIISKKEVDTFVKEVEKAKNIFIYTHVNPDGDTLGSGLALYTFLKNINKNVRIFADDSMSDKYRQLPNADKLETKVETKKIADLGISVDVSVIDRIGDHYGSFRRSKYKVVVDHHKTNSTHANLNIINYKAAATAELMFVLLKALEQEYKKGFTDDVAELLYTGLLTDTGCFAYDSVKEETFRIAAELSKYKFDRLKVTNTFMFDTEYNKFRLKQRCYDNAKFYFNNEVVISYYTQDDFKATNTDMTYTEGIINDFLHIKGVKIVVTLSEIDEFKYKGSIRTAVGVDATQIASVFSGGGHVRASGFQSENNLEQTIAILLEKCKSILKK